MRLNATILGREALRLLHNEIRKPTPDEGPWPGSFKLNDPREGVFYANVGLEEGTLDAPLEGVSQHFVWPAMRRLAQKVKGIPLGDEFMELPKGFDDVANDCFGGIAMRTIINKTMPWNGERHVWRRMAEYYDIAEDRLKTGPCGICLHFTVHKPGAATYIPTVHFEEKPA